MSILINTHLRSATFLHVLSADSLRQENCKPVPPCLFSFQFHFNLSRGKTFLKNVKLVGHFLFPSWKLIATLDKVNLSLPFKSIWLGCLEIAYHEKYLLWSILCVTVCVLHGCDVIWLHLYEHLAKCISISEDIKIFVFNMLSKENCD